MWSHSIGIGLRCVHDFQLAARMREARVGARGVWRQILALVKFSAQYISRLRCASALILVPN